MVDWGMNIAPGIVMDPSCGDGRFLCAAARRGATSVIGCDLDPEALAYAHTELASLGAQHRLHRCDFFRLESGETGLVDLLLGNPPYIRYQQFSGESRSRALASALRVGARLSRLAASWAPFLLHGLQFVRPGGAMAMVVPAELAQTAYGVETLRALCGNFGRVRLLAFRHNWFEDAQQETFVLLAERRGEQCPSAELIPLGRIDDLKTIGLAESEDRSVPLGVNPDTGLGLAFLPPQTRGPTATLMASPETQPLRALGEVVNGYVSGANAFFHCTLADAATRELPADWLVPVARNSRSLTGLTYRSGDVAAAERQGVSHHLILPRTEDLFSNPGEPLDAFIREGRRSGIHERYKCRVRDPWWRVPGLIRADVFLPYMIGSKPHAAVNQAHALYTNSLHGIRLANPVTAPRVALGLLSSLSLLSMELVGRSYGGGILKLEPTEMQRVRLVLPTWDEPEAKARLAATDSLIRAGDFQSASRLVDRWLLKEQAGLTDEEIGHLSQAREILLKRRLTKSRGAR